MNTKTLSIAAFAAALVIPILGFVLGIIALKKSGKGDGAGKGFAIAAVIIGSIWLAFAGLVLLIAFLGVFGMLLVPALKT